MAYSLSYYPYHLFLNIGITLTTFSALENMPWRKEQLINSESGFAMLAIAEAAMQGSIPSRPTLWVARIEWLSSIISIGVAGFIILMVNGSNGSPGQRTSLSTNGENH
jgi:hypothetical protein